MTSRVPLQLPEEQADREIPHNLLDTALPLLHDVYAAPRVIRFFCGRLDSGRMAWLFPQMHISLQCYLYSCVKSCSLCARLGSRLLLLPDLTTLTPSTPIITTIVPRISVEFLSGCCSLRRPGLAATTALVARPFFVSVLSKVKTTANVDYLPPKALHSRHDLPYEQGQCC